MLSIIQTEKEEESLVVIYADDGTFSYIISEGTTKIYYLLPSLRAAKVDSEELSIYKKHCADGKPGAKILFISTSV
jgi:hypothetical protein